MNKHHALANQGITKTKFFTCFVAVVLAFGLTAMPALAVPGSDGAESTITIVAVDDTAEGAQTEAAPAPSKEPAAPEAPAKQPAKDESSTADTKKDTASTEGAQAGQTDKKELNAAEKAAAVLQGETRLAVANSTGISAQSSYGSYGTYGEQDPVDSIIEEITGMSSSYTYDIRLDKLMTGPLYTTKNEDGSVKEASYTVMFEIEGTESDAAGSAVVYTKRSIGIKVGHDGSGTLELKNLPQGYYTIKEIVGYPGCAYVCTTQNPVSFWIGYAEEQQDQGDGGSILKYDTNETDQVITATATFKNKANDDQKIFSQGYVNEYSLSGGQLGFEVKQ